jgi:Flp pilus assembly pilin Flp
MVRGLLEGVCEMKALLKKFVRESEGQDLIEYALLASVIALGVTAGMIYVRNQLNSEFTSIAQSITTSGS